MKALLLTLIFSHSIALADTEGTAIELRWRAFEKICDATFVIKDFAQMVRSGISFQMAAKSTKEDLRKFTTVTCPKNWDKLNGQKSAKEIIPEFQRLSNSSLDLKERADKQGAAVAEVYDSIATDLRVLEVSLGKTKCGQALNSMMATYKAEKAEIHRRYKEIETSCPALAGLEKVQTATAGAARTYGKSGGAGRVPSGAATPRQSDLTGTQKALDEKTKAKAIIEK